MNHRKSGRCRKLDAVPSRRRRLPTSSIPEDEIRNAIAERMKQFDQMARDQRLGIANEIAAHAGVFDAVMSRLRALTEGVGPDPKIAYIAMGIAFEFYLQRVQETDPARMAGLRLVAMEMATLTYQDQKKAKG